LILWEIHLRGRKPPAEKWAFLSGRLIFQGGWENKEIIYILELLDKARYIKSKL